MKEVSFGNDGSISKDQLENCINSDLANNYGNLCQRVLAFAKKNCENKIPKNEFNEQDITILKTLSNTNKIREYIDNHDVNKYMEFILNGLFASNKYFNDQAPWGKKDNLKRLNTIVYTSLELIRKLTILLYPVMPETCAKVLNVFNIDSKNISISSIENNDLLKCDNILNSLSILFKKIEK